MSQSGLYLTHVQAVLQTDHLYEIVPNVCGQWVSTLPNISLYFIFAYVLARTRRGSIIISFAGGAITSRVEFTLNSGCEIYGIEATGTELFVGSLFSFAKTVPRVMFAPEVRTPVSERNV